MPFFQSITITNDPPYYPHESMGWQISGPPKLVINFRLGVLREKNLKSALVTLAPTPSFFICVAGLLKPDPKFEVAAVVNTALRISATDFLELGPMGSLLDWLLWNGCKFRHKQPGDKPWSDWVTKAAT
jgi:hypothetical protein